MKGDSLKVVKFSPIYGNNIGDIHISKCIEYGLSQHKISVQSHDILFRNIGSFTQNSGRKKMRHFISLFLQLKTPFIFYLLKKMIFKLSGAKNKFGDLVEDADAVIFGGGNLLMSKMGSDYAYRIAKYSMQNRDVLSIVFSCGAGPFDFDEKSLIRKIWENVDFLSVRDFNSKLYFEKYSLKGCHVIPDPAFIISDMVSKKQPPAEKSYIGINIIMDYFSEEELKVFAEEVVKSCWKFGLGVKIINTAFPFDSEFSERFISMLRVVDKDLHIISIDIEENVESLTSAYQNLEYFVGCRMHSLIFALSFSVPCLGFNWDDKVKGMFQVFLDGKPESRILSKKFETKLSQQLETIDHEIDKKRLEEVKMAVYGGFSAIAERIKNKG